MILECRGCHKMYRVRDGTPEVVQKCPACGGGPLARPGEPEPPTDHLRCPSCRHVNQENWNFCSACGTMREA